MPDETTREDLEQEDPGKRGPNQTEDAEVEGHKRLTRLNEDADDDAEVEGHMRPKH